MKTRLIYVLNLNNNIHYVGKTKNPYNREKAHKKKYPNSIFEIIDEVPTEEWKFWERHYISLYRSWGFILNNIKQHGGNGSDILSAEHKNKISESLKLAYIKNPRSEETYKKIGAGNKGKIMSEESRRKIAEGSKGNTSHKGFKHSDETRKIISDKNKGKIVTEETRLNLSKACKGKINSDETKKRMSLANLGKILSKEHKLKLSESHKGKIVSVETKAKMAEAQRKRHAKNKTTTTI